MHQFDTMTEPELGRLMTRVACVTKKRLPPDTGFIILAAPFGSNQVAQYVANGERLECIQWLRETATRLENRDSLEKTPWT